MNTANLQLKGILLALYALLNALKLNALKRKGVLNQQEIEAALEEAEANSITEARERNELSKANAEAISFPVRFCGRPTPRQIQRNVFDSHAACCRRNGSRLMSKHTE